MSAIVALALKPRPARQEQQAIVPPVSRGVSTNQFTISGLRIEAQGSLRYVQGTARNDGPEQRFGVTIQLELLDADERRVGSASDYRAIVSTNEVWKFRALVVESNAVTATLRAITESR